MSEHLGHSPIGSLSPNAIHVPGIFVDRIVQATEPKEIEVLALAKNKEDQVAKGVSAGTEHTQHTDGENALDWRHRIAARAAKEIKDGFYVNLGVGIPTIVPEVRSYLYSCEKIVIMLTYFCCT